MTKYAILVGFILLSTATVAQTPTATLTEYNCANGHGDTVISTTNKKYCQSRIEMNWWSAFAWCQSIGGTLIDLNEDCEDTSITNTPMPCPALYNPKNNAAVWTANVPDSTYAYVVLSSSGTIRNNWASRENKIKVLCRIK